MSQNKGAAAMDDAAIDVTKPKLERFRGNESVVEEDMLRRACS
jgi:hypothetical protein